MQRGRPKAELRVPPEDQATLQRWVGRGKTAQAEQDLAMGVALALRSRIVLLSFSASPTARSRPSDTGFYRMPVFVLTHRAHEAVVKGETTFTFVTDGIESAIAQARVAAHDREVHIMGGASVAQQALRAGLVDSLHLHVAPVVLAAGTRLFDDLTEQITLERTEIVESLYATHLRFRVIRGGAASTRA